MATSLLGIIILVFAVGSAFVPRTGGNLSFFDWHAMLVVFGGVLGSLFLAIDRKALWRMAGSLKSLFGTKSTFHYEMSSIDSELIQMRQAWRSMKRKEVLNLAEHAKTPEIRLAADALLRRLKGPALEECFSELRAQYKKDMMVMVEGWDMVARLGPSFGMVGTVTGMVQLFRNMSEHAGNLGGAMALALLATLYGIALGAAVGGPMASRINNQLQTRLTTLDLIEKTIKSLVSDDSSNTKKES